MVSVPLPPRYEAPFHSDRRNGLLAVPSCLFPDRQRLVRIGTRILSGAYSSDGTMRADQLDQIHIEKVKHVKVCSALMPEANLPMSIALFGCPANHDGRCVTEGGNYILKIEMLGRFLYLLWSATRQRIDKIDGTVQQTKLTLAKARNNTSGTKMLRKVVHFLWACCYCATLEKKSEEGGADRDITWKGAEWLARFIEISSSVVRITVFSRFEPRTKQLSHSCI